MFLMVSHVVPQHYLPEILSGAASPHMKMKSAGANLSVGFAVVGEYDDPKIQEAQASAFEQMIRWLKTH